MKGTRRSEILTGGYFLVELYEQFRGEDPQLRMNEYATTSFCGSIDPHSPDATATHTDSVGAANRNDGTSSGT